MTGPLKLRAEDAEDLDVVSACLQDAIVPLSDMEYLAGEKRFVLVANRFRWENCGETAEMPVVDPAADPRSGQGANADVGFAQGCRSYERVNCGVAFEGVEQVRRRGIDPRDRSRMLELLAMRIEAEAITLSFAGNAAIRLEGRKIVCRLSDLGEPWPTQWRPRHPGGDAI
jgi:hypothetical protein